MEILKSKFNLFVVLFLVLSSCSSDNNSIVNNDSLSVKSRISQEFSDKEIFEGIFLGMGNVADIIPSIDSEYVNAILKEMTEEEILILEDFKDEIYLTLRDENSFQFQEFITAMKSGDNELISEQLISFSEVDSSYKY